MDIRWGIIGVGDVTEVKSGPAFNKIRHSGIVAVMRRNAEKAAGYARRHNVPKWYTDASLLINDTAVNAVYIATPPDTHACYAIEAMQAGKPVYVEKPMARNYKECQEMIRVSEETGVPLFVAYYRRALPAFLKVKELVESGIIGKPLLANIRLLKAATEQNPEKEGLPWRVIPEISGGGHFFDLASHQLDFFDYLFDPITKVNGMAQNLGGYYPAEDTVTGNFIFEKGVVGTGIWCFAADISSEEDTMEIIGAKGKISFPCFASGDIVLTTSKGAVNFSFERPAHVEQNLISLIVDELRGVGKCPGTMYSAARTSLVMDKMVENYYNLN